MESMVSSGTIGSKRTEGCESLQDQFIPKRKEDSKEGKRRPWLTREVKDSIKIKEKYNSKDEREARGLGNLKSNRR